MTEIAIVKTQAEAGRIAADLIVAALAKRDEPTLGLATGSTPLPVWSALAERSLDLSAVRGFALDEYVGLPDGHPESYRAVVDRDIVAPLGLDPRACACPATTRVRWPSRRALRGRDRRRRRNRSADPRHRPHRAHRFNEPGSSLASRTRLKALTPATRADNARFFPRIDDVPTHCLTQGIGTILRRAGARAARVRRDEGPRRRRRVEGPLTSSCPASAIQLHRRARGSSSTRPQPPGSSTATTTASPGITARSRRHDRRPAAHRRPWWSTPGATCAERGCRCATADRRGGLGAGPARR